MTEVETTCWPDPVIIHVDATLRLEYVGPDLTDPASRPAHVVVAFAPVDFPFDAGGDGWGSRSFRKRGIAHVCVFHSAPDWYQNDAFFTAMARCRAVLGDDMDLTAYGFSMGGYGAILAADALNARRVVAVSPQFSIDPAVVPFERRYKTEWAAMGSWRHDLREHRRDAGREVIVLLDPLHRLDRKQEALFAKPAGHTRCLIHGAGHAGIQTLGEMGIIEVLFDLLRGDASARDLRWAYRQNRRQGFRYLRKVGTRLHKRAHPMAPQFMDWARARRFRRLIKKWRPFYD